MKLFEHSQAEHTVIIGCGRLGAGLADTLYDNGGNVTVIDIDKDAFRKLSPAFGGLTVVGDATDIDLLHDIGMEKAADVIVVTNNDNTNIMVAQLAKEMFKVQRVIARLYDPERECVYRQLEIDTICPSVLSVNEIGHMLSAYQKEKAS